MESIGKIAKKLSEKRTSKVSISPKIPSSSASNFAKATSDEKASEDDLQLSKKRWVKNPHLHSPAHLLADELCQKLNDKKHFGFYLKMATLYDHAWLRKLCGEILENKNAKTPGRLFAYLIKKRNQELKSENR